MLRRLRVVILQELPPWSSPKGNSSAFGLFTSQMKHHLSSAKERFSNLHSLGRAATICVWDSKIRPLHSTCWSMWNEWHGLSNFAPSVYPAGCSKPNSRPNGGKIIVLHSKNHSLGWKALFSTWSRSLNPREGLPDSQRRWFHLYQEECKMPNFIASLLTAATARPPVRTTSLTFATKDAARPQLLEYFPLLVSVVALVCKWIVVRYLE